MTKIVLDTIFKWNIFFFSQTYFSHLNLFMFSNFEPNFIEKFLWESVFFFSNFGHVTIFAKWKFVFWPPFQNGSFIYLFFSFLFLFFFFSFLFFSFFFFFFLLIYGCLWCVQVRSKFRTKFTTGKKKSLKWLGSSGPPLVHKREWKVAKGPFILHSNCVAVPIYR